MTRIYHVVIQSYVVHAAYYLTLLCEVVVGKRGFERTVCVVVRDYYAVRPRNGYEFYKFFRLYRYAVTFTLGECAYSENLAVFIEKVQFQHFGCSFAEAHFHKRKYVSAAGYRGETVRLVAH